MVKLHNWTKIESIKFRFSIKNSIIVNKTHYERDSIMLVNQVFKTNKIAITIFKK